MVNFFDFRGELLKECLDLLDKVAEIDSDRIDSCTYIFFARFSLFSLLLELFELELEL